MGYLSLPKRTGKTLIVIWTHTSDVPAIYIWNDLTYHGYKNLLDAGIGAMFVDNFSHRGAGKVWRDQSRVPLINGPIAVINFF